MGSTTTVHAGEPWPDITKVCAASGPRRAAIAFVGEAAPTLLPLQSGDVLVVNASDAALLARATHPAALATFVGRGVAVYSHPKLHAKVLTTRRTAVIGSANASMNSTGLQEAVTVTTDPMSVARVKRFVDDLITNGATEVEDVFLDHARMTWARGRAGGPPGSDGGRHPVDDFLSGSPRVYVAEWESYTASQAELNDMQATLRKVRRSAGPAARYRLDTLRFDTGGPTPRPGDAVLLAEVEDGEWWLAPPAMVIAGPIKIPYGRGAVYFVLKHDANLDYANASDVIAALDSAGVKSNIYLNWWLRDRAARAALLGVWKLGSGRTPSAP